MDPRDLQRLLARQRRQEPREAPRQHRLARPGGACQQEVVTAGGGKLERAPRALLTSNVCEVECREMRTVSVRGRGYERRRIVLPAQIADGLREVVQRHRL